MNDPYEQDREDNAVGEIYGVSEFDIPEPTVDDAMAEPDQLQRALIAYRIIQLDNIRKAAKETTTQDTFLMAALRRNKVL